LQPNVQLEGEDSKRSLLVERPSELNDLNELLGNTPSIHALNSITWPEELEETARMADLVPGQAEQTAWIPGRPDPDGERIDKSPSGHPLSFDLV
jgi:hypothetical protein